MHRLVARAVTGSVCLSVLRDAQTCGARVPRARRRQRPSRCPLCAPGSRSTACTRANHWHGSQWRDNRPGNRQHSRLYQAEVDVPRRLSRCEEEAGGGDSAGTEEMLHFRRHRRKKRRR
eukprot:360570-Pleurochrysis_carterae.AAC.2